MLGVHWWGWVWSWNSNTLAIWCEELTHLKRPWCRERLRAGEGGDRGWDSWMASPTWWTWIWVDSGSWWWTGEPGVLQFMGSQRVGHDWVTELNWKSLLPFNIAYLFFLLYVMCLLCPTCLPVFVFVFVFSNLMTIYLAVCIYSLWWFLSFLDLWSIILELEKIKLLFSPNIFFCSIFSPFEFPTRSILNWSVLYPLGSLDSFFKNVTSFYFYNTIFFISEISVWFILTVFLSLLKLLCIIKTAWLFYYSLKYIYYSYKFHHSSNICAISKSGSIDCFVS